MEKNVRNIKTQFNLNSQEHFIQWNSNFNATCQDKFSENCLAKKKKAKNLIKFAFAK